MDLEIQDRAFLITGGTDGLGLALAQRLVAEGAFVAVCGRDEDGSSEHKCCWAWTRCARRPTSRTPSNSMSSSAPTLTRFGRLDGAVNNAGRSAGSPIATSDDDEWRSDYELKVIAALHVARQVLPALETTQGAIVNVLAILARTPNANTTPTSASRLAGSH